jgi:S-adenosylmethionine hydrolase
MACITLLSDFGLQGASVAVAKAILMRYAAGMPIVDISHEIAPFDIKHGAYLASASYMNFPAGTCHLIMIDLFNEPNPKLILTEVNKHYFFVPDNGMASIIADGQAYECRMLQELTKEHTFTDWVSFAANAIKLLQSATPGQNGLTEYEPRRTKAIQRDTNETDGIDCTIVHIDHYENVVLNITRKQFEERGNGKRFKLQIMEIEEINEISLSYNDVREGTKLCRFNSNGHLEICVNRGNAASLFGLRLNSSRNNIKLVFE